MNLSNEEMQNCLSDCGCCIAGQTPSLVPADRLMYATRDITATVDNVGLITGGILFCCEGQETFFFILLNLEKC